MKIGWWMSIASIVGVPASAFKLVPLIHSQRLLRAMYTFCRIKGVVTSFHCVGSGASS